METSKKIALVTGASGGIGYALCKKLLHENYVVIATSRSGEIKGIIDNNLFVVKLDINDENSIKQAQKEIIENFKSLDLLINNAGIGPDLGALKPDMELMAKTFHTNVFGLISFAEPLLDMVKGNGQLINISSIMGSVNLCASPTSVAYRMSKAALNMYTKILANRLIEKAVKVISVHPGWVRTNISKNNYMAPLSAEDSAEGIYKLILRNLPTGSFWNAETQEEIPW